MDDTRVRRVVEAVSNGEPVDWVTLRSRLDDPATLDYCAHLETLSKIGYIRGGERRQQPEPSESRWVSTLLALALLQILVGLIGFVVYREHSVVNALRLLTVLSFGGMGLVLRRHRYEPRARDLGAIFLLRAFGFSRNPYTLVVDAWFAGSSAAAFLRSGFALDVWVPWFTWRFVRRFPATHRFSAIDRFAFAATRVAGIVGTVLFAVNLLAALAPGLSGVAATFAVTYEEGQRFSAVIYALVLPALPVILVRGRAAPTDERARLRLFAVAMALGSAPTYVEVIIEALFPQYTAFLRGSTSALTTMVVIVLLPLLTIPFITGYAVVVHRLLDVRFAVRLGMRYLLAKHTVTLLAVAPFGLLAWHVYSHRHESVVAVVANGRGMFFALLAALGASLWACRSLLLKSLDRWFRRSDSDRTAVLAQIGDALRMVRTRSELAAAVTRAASDALNTAAVVHFFDPQQQAYVPFGRGGLALSAHSALATMLIQEPTLRSLATDSEGAIARLLPRGERLWLEGENVCALAPVRTTGIDQPSALIALGPRRDAPDYSRDDEQFVVALASAAGITLENLRLKAAGLDGDPEDDFGMLCVRCHRVADREAGSTCACGGPLQAAAVPRRINGKFLVEALLGAGGMGVAYLASDLQLSRHVAIKTLPFVSADMMARLANEARTMAALSHPNLATIFGLELWRGTPILVCEYLRNGTLQHRLERGPLATEEALTLVRTVLDALEYMHQRHILHRDIKPSNIGFTSEGTVKLLDFGLAGLVESASPSASLGSQSRMPHATSLAGTVAYLPPQAFSGTPPSSFFDLWALAVVLFECVEGHHPFAAGPDTVHNICGGHIVGPTVGRPGAPEAVRAFLHEVLTTPGHRQLSSSTAMRDALTTLRSSSPLTR